jgi:hypothetical protein
MARLPKVGGDDNTWGGVLNDFLGQEHNPDGTLKNVVRPTDSRLTDSRTPKAHADSHKTGGSDALAPTDIGADPAGAAAAVAANMPTLNVGAFGTLGTSDDAAVWQAALDAAKTLGPIRVIAPVGTATTLRAVKIHPYTHLDLRGVTVSHGGSNAGTTVEGSVPTFYTDGSETDGHITITGGTIIGGRPAGDFTHIQGATSNDAIYLYNAPLSRVIGVTFINTGQDGITLDASDGSCVVGCSFTDGGDSAIELRSGGNYTVRDNVVSQHRNGVGVKPNVHDVLIQGNNFTTFNEGILLHGLRWRIVANTITPITTPDGIVGSSYPGIRYADDWSGTITTYSGSDIYIEGNTITGRTTSKGIYFGTLSGATTLARVFISHNTITTCQRGVQMSAAQSSFVIDGNNISTTDRCIWAASATAIRVMNNDLTSDGSGSTAAVDISATSTQVVGNRITAAAVAGVNVASGAASAVITNNVITTSTIGVKSAATKTRIAANTISATGAAGISLESGGTYASVTGNDLAATSAEGVTIKAGADNATVTGNDITSGTQGVRAAANNAVLTGNRISGSTYWGVSVSTGATDTVIVGNNLIGNSSGAISDSGTTTLAANNRLATGA